MRIHGAGCSLVDNLYTPVDFNSGAYRKWLAGKDREEGLITGGLVFGDELEQSAGIEYADIIEEITGGLKSKRNIGGPAVVALIHLSQISDIPGLEIAYYGTRADDEPGEYLVQKLSLFDLNLDNYAVAEGRTPFTDVLSDPSFNGNSGERTFINYIGVAQTRGGSDLPESFYEADILILGGTALTPGLHDELSLVMKRGRQSGCLIFVNTVYDFRNQKRNPGKPWPVVEKEPDFNLIDLFIADNEEAILTPDS